MKTTFSIASVVTLALAASISFAPPAQARESTISQTLTEIRYDAQADFAYLVGPATWGSPSCPNATYGQVTSNVPGRKQLLALAASAKLAGTKVQLIGDCASNPGYFDVQYIVVGQ